MLTNESERIGKGGQGFVIPGSLTNGKGMFTQQLLSKNGDQRKERQQGGSGTQDRQIRPLALRLHAQMCTYLVKGDLYCPAQDKPLHNLDRLCLLIGAEQGHGLVLALGVANEHPADRHRRNGGLIPESRASGNFHLTRRSPIPGQRVFLPLRCGIGEASRQLGLLFAFQRIEASFSCFSYCWGRLVQTGIQTQSCHCTHTGQAAADFQQEVQHRIRPISHDHQLRDQATSEQLAGASATPNP